MQLAGNVTLVKVQQHQQRRLGECAELGGGVASGIDPEARRR